MPKDVYEKLVAHHPNAGDIIRVRLQRALVLSLAGKVMFEGTYKSVRETQFGGRGPLL
jgi:hypothetical protein